MEPTEISAGRLHLRPWQPDDAPAVLAACADPAIQRWTTVPSPYSEQDARAFVGELSPAGWDAGTAAQFAVLDATTGELLAAVGLKDVAEGSAEVGFWAVPRARGRGVVTEAVGVVCRWGFGALGLQRVLWRAEVGNLASRAVAEKAGFTVEGTLRAGLPARNGGRVDGWVGSLLADDEVRDRRAFGRWRDRERLGLTLRRWRPDDVDALLAGAGDPETARWVPVAVPFTPDVARWTLEEQYPLRWATGRAADLAVVEDGQVVGYVTLIPRADRLAPEVGWWTVPAARGRGVAGRAARLVAEWADELGHPRVEAHVAAANIASQRAALRAGFVLEGRRRAAGRDREGRPYDLLLFGRLHAEAPAPSGTGRAASDPAGPDAIAAGSPGPPARRRPT